MHLPFSCYYVVSVFPSLLSSPSPLYFLVWWFWAMRCGGGGGGGEYNGPRRGGGWSQENSARIVRFYAFALPCFCEMNALNGADLHTSAIWAHTPACLFGLCLGSDATFCLQASKCFRYAFVCCIFVLMPLPTLPLVYFICPQKKIKINK